MLRHCPNCLQIYHLDHFSSCNRHDRHERILCHGRQVFLFELQTFLGLLFLRFFIRISVEFSDYLLSMEINPGNRRVDKKGREKRRVGRLGCDVVYVCEGVCGVSWSNQSNNELAPRSAPNEPHRRTKNKETKKKKKKETVEENSRSRR